VDMSSAADVSEASNASLFKAERSTSLKASEAPPTYTWFGDPTAKQQQHKYLEDMGSEVVVAELEILSLGVRNTTEYVGQEVSARNRDSNPRTAQYQPRILPARSSVKYHSKGERKITRGVGSASFNLYPRGRNQIYVFLQCHFIRSLYQYIQQTVACRRMLKSAPL
jgi:hypothetical protein